MKVLLFLAAAAFTAGSPKPLPADIAWVAEGRFCEPETVLPLPDNTLLVSNVCDFRKTGTGFLTLLDANGKVLNWRIVDNLDSPLGMALVNQQLYVVDSNQVRIFDWPGYTSVTTIRLETKVANDIAVAPDGTFYISDTGAHQVIKRTPDGTRSVLTGKAQFKGANGIALDGSHLYVGGARLWCVNLDSELVTPVGPDWLADIDGIEFETDGALQITPVGGPLVRYWNDNDITVYGGEGVSSANHGFAPRLNLALIPTGYDNTVIAIRVPVRRKDK